MNYQELIRILLIWTIVTTCIGPLKAQQQWTYDFNNGLLPIESGGPALKVLGNPGKFVKEDIPDTEYLQRTVYQFEENSGLQFNNALTKGFLSKSFTVELYFKMNKLDSWKRILDFKNRKSDYGSYIYDGKLNFYDYAISEKAPVRANQYVHYVYSRDFETKTIKMYINGQSKVEFTDPGTEGILDADQVLNIFQDDLIANHEASAGSVALIRLYDRVMTPVFIRRSYHSLRRPQQKTMAETPPETVEEKLPEINISAPKISNVTGKVYDGNNLQPVNDADILVRKAEDNSLVAQAKTVDGNFSFDLLPFQNYQITAQAEGFYLRSIPIRTKSRNEEIKSLISLSPDKNTTPLATLFFDQSEQTLSTEATAQLDAMVAYFKEHPKLRIFIKGHTDNLGDFAQNLALSEARVDMCKQYLIDRGIEAHRISGKGYGPAQPLRANNTESLRKMNRRVEIWKSSVL
ncbi:OmpA family protein [Dyadobacter tibetensis]|uniref:OmpA family protein n=1 Tax=Dyadobacter tibetensis TaxID=1211851 RepID=UPI00046F6D11|nr:OmpA family protein [Dyadobacter tibetensis]